MYTYDRQNNNSYLVPREMTRNLLFVHVDIPIQVSYWVFAKFLTNVKTRIDFISERNLNV